VKVHWEEVDGVTALSLEDGEVRGPLQACLMFGAGRCDETILVSGINHAIEHLALQPLHPTSYAWNGQVDTVGTRFVVVGRPEQVVEYLHLVVAHLRELPIERLADELRVLAIEEERRGGSQLGLDLANRLGPNGAGLVGYPEHGLKRVGADEVVEWSRTWFTAGNAVLWTSGPIPAGLDLSGLPPGPAPARLPAPTSIPPPRSFVSSPTQIVSVSGISEQQLGVLPIMEIARMRALDRLRRSQAVTYAIEFIRVRVGGGRSLAYLGADAAQGAAQAVFDGLVSVMEELAADGPTEQERDYTIGAWREQSLNSEAHLARIDGDAERHLLGLPFIPFDQASAEYEALTPEQMRDDLAEITPTLLAIGPEELGRQPAGWWAYEHWSRGPVLGRTYHAIEGREQGKLIVGPEGVSWVPDDNHVRTVRWDEAVACFVWDDGRRHVVGPTGTAVFVIPWNWRSSHDLTERVDAAIEEARRIHLGEGVTQYLENPDDPQSAVDVRWLGTVSGARHGGQRVDLVIDTDGVFLLYGRRTDDPFAERTQALHVEDRDALLAEDPRNRWIPVTEIGVVEMILRPWTRIRGVKGTARIRLRDGTKMDIHMKQQNQVQIAHDNFRRVLGPLYVV
jgi:hypothetical protein